MIAFTRSKSGADEFLAKPFSAHDLETLMAAFLQP